MKHTIKPHGRHHSMPKGIYGFFSDLESLAGVESVNSGRFIPRQKVNGFEAKIQFYDENRRTFRLKVCSDGFISYPEVRVAPDADTIDKIEDYIRNYNPKKSKQATLPVLQNDFYGLNQNSMVGVF